MKKPIGNQRGIPGQGELANLLRAKDWSQTSLGAIDSWPQSLRTAVSILTTSRYAMWLGWGPELSFMYNDAYAPTLGQKHPQALGQPASKVWAEIWPMVGPRIERVIEGGEATWDEALLLFLERNGFAEETYHTFSYSPLPDDDGTVGGMFCVVTEETERVIGERRLRLLRDLASELSASNDEADILARFAACLGPGGRDLPFAAVYLFDDDGGQARRAALSGFPAEAPEVPERIGLDAGAPWALAALHEGTGAVSLTAEDGVSWPSGPCHAAVRQALVLPIARPGTSRPVGALVAGVSPDRPFDSAYRDFVGLVVGQLSTALASARAYAEERKRAQALADLDRAKTAFFSNVSHEFRTPLTLMLGPLTDLLEGGAVPPAQLAELSRVHRNGLRLLKLVNTMLDFSRIEAGRAQARYEPVDLAQHTADLASLFASATERAGLRFEVAAEPVGEDVFVDRDMWEKIVLNLISNAFKFTLKGRIRVEVERHGQEAHLRVIDSGVGIPRDELGKVFERFHRVASTRGRTFEGTGIGLALVHELVKLHGGRLSVVSEVGVGTTFTVALPLGVAHLPAEHLHARVETAGAVGSPAQQAFVEEALLWIPAGEAVPEPVAREGSDDRRPSRARIVLADDSADMRDYMRRLLGERWDIEVVPTGTAALAAIRRERPDLVITDVMMPELDGFGLLAELQADERTRHLPVIMLSARAGEEARAEGLQAGATDYLVKPFSSRELLASVESKLLAARLRAVEEAQVRRMTRIFAQAPVGFALLRGPRHVFELANPNYLELVGHGDVVGKPVREALPELAGQGVYELLDQVHRSGQAHTARSFRLVLARGTRAAEECFFDFVYQPIVDETGKVEAIAVVVFEVSELARARRDAEIANRTKDEFLAMLGHELRNPLAPILTALQLMRMRDHGGERELAVIERQVEHLVALVDDLLDVSRITQGKVQLRKERCELADAVARAVEMASPLLDRQRHTVEIEVPRGLVVDADPGRLAQIFANLLTNAAKYTPADGQVTVRAAVDADDVVLTVADTGIGIDSEMLRRVFEPFAQEHQAIDRSQGGLGLGLAIVSSLVRLHGGQVSASSAGRGLGSEFAVRLPRAADGPAVVRKSRPSGSLSVPVQRARVLVVDDNTDAAEMLATIVQTWGYEARHVADGPAALALAAHFRPDLAILDIGLPVMDGFELARRFANDEHLRATRLVALTGYGQAHDRQRSAEAGFIAHLIKPVPLQQLRELIAAQLS